MRFEFARLRDERHPVAAPKRRHGRALFKVAVQSAPEELPDVVWLDGVLFVVEP